MIDSSKKLLLQALSVLALAAAGCTGAGQIPCVDNSSCPSDYPVCGSAGKCVAGTSNTQVSVRIIGVAGKQPGDPVRGTVIVQVSAQSLSGVRLLSLTGGAQTFAPVTGSAGPVYDIAVDTTKLTEGAVSLTATVTPGDSSVQPLTSAAFIVTVDNTVPVLTVPATLPPAQLGSLVILDVTASEPVRPLVAEVLFSGDVIGQATELSAPTGNVHHLGFAVVPDSPPGTYTFQLTATDLAGNSTATTATSQFSVAAAPSAALALDTANITIGASAHLTPTFANGTGAISANPIDATLPGTVTTGQQITVSPTLTTVYTLTVSNAAGAIATSTATVFVGQNVPVSLVAPGPVVPGQSVVLVANVAANATQAVVVPGNLSVTADGTNQNVPVSVSVTTTFTLIATNSAGQEFRATATVVVTQPALASLAGPDVITTGTAPTFTVQFTPATASATVTPGCTGGTVTGTSPASQTFTCSTITGITTYTAAVALGSASSIATHVVQVVGNPATTSLSFPGGAIVPGAPANFSGQGCVSCTITFNPQLTLDTGSLSGAFTAHLSANPSSSTTVVMSVSNAAGASVANSATAVVTQPSVTSFGGPDVVTSGSAFAIIAQFSPLAATSAVTGCAGGVVTGTGPFQRTFTCTPITGDATYTLDVTLGTIVIHASTSVQVAPDPTAGLVFKASPPVLPFGSTTDQTILTALFCAGGVRCTATYSANGGPPVIIPNNTDATVLQTITTTYAFLVTNTAGATASSQITVPSYGAQFVSNAMNAARVGAAAALLPSGKVLVAGGSSDGTRTTAVASAEVYDPSTNSWSNVSGTCSGLGTAAMHAARFQATATVLANSSVLVAGGSNISSTALTSVDVYDPVGDCFQLAAPLQTPRSGHTATAYNAGAKAVIIGGGVDMCEVFAQGSSLINGTFTSCDGSGSSPFPTMSISRTNHVAVLLSNRYVFVAGGNAGDRNADIYDTNSNGTNGFTRLTGNPMVNGRTSASASLLTTGKVVIVGGSGSGSTSQSAELFTFNPGTVSGTSVATGTGLTNAHVGHAAILLNGGGVLIAGGSASGLVEVWLESDALENPNGLFLDGDKLMVAGYGVDPDGPGPAARGPGRVLVVDLATKAVTPLGNMAPLGNLDGIEKLGSDWILGDNSGHVWRVTPDGKPTELAKIANAADLGLRRGDRVAAVPTLSDNTVQFLTIP